MTQTYWEKCLRDKFFKDKKVYNLKRKILESNHIIYNFKEVRKLLEESKG